MEHNESFPNDRARDPLPYAPRTRSMKLVIYPAIESDRLVAIQAAAPGAFWVNAASVIDAEAAMPGADGFLGKITPGILARADCLAWVQSFTASLEHYMFPALVEHPCLLTNERGLFGD